MSQATDYTVDNSTGANVRADINAIFGAIATNNSGGSDNGSVQALGFLANTSTSKLQLKNAAGNAFINLRGFDGTLPLPDGSVSSPSLFFDDDTNTGLFSSAADTLNVTTGGVERVELSGTATVFNESGADVNFRIEGDTQQHLFFVDAGNNLIGIGTSSPSSAHAGADDLVIGDYSASGAGISINTTTSGSGNIYFGDASGTNRRGRIEYDHANDAFRIYTADSEGLRVDSSGRLLIGTTASRTIQGASKLQIEDDTTSLLSIVRTSNNNGAAFITIGKTRNGSILQSGDVIGVLNFHGDDGSDLVTPAAQIRAAVDGTPGSNDMPGRLEFLTTLDGNSASSERMRITNAGNVGINDTEPDAKLSVFMSAINIGYGASGNSSGTFKLIQGYGYRIGTNLYGNVGIYTTYDSGTNQGSLDFYTGTGGTGTAERMRLSAGGSLGIGTTSPKGTAHIHISAGARNDFSSSADGLIIEKGGDTGLSIDPGASGRAAIFFPNESNHSIASITHNNSDGEFRLRAEDHMIFATNANTDRMRINNEGLLLINEAKNGMSLGFGQQQLSVKAGTFSPAILESTGATLTSLIVTNSSTSAAVNMVDMRCARSNNSAFTFFIMRSGATSSSSGDTEMKFVGDGNAFADGSFTGGGADYAEYFEWADGNSSDEDRRGYTVVLDGNKIRKSTSSDAATTIIGVVSGNPSVVGDGDIDRWKQKYQKDDYGTYIRDENGDKILNSEFDETKTYISRAERKEWDIIGLMGKIRVRKGQTMGTNWIKMQDISDTVEEWLVR